MDLFQISLLNKLQLPNHIDSRLHEKQNDFT